MRSTRLSAKRFLDEIAANERFFTDGPRGKPHFDLEAYVVHRLIAAGIGEVEALHLDTYADAERFFSYRRATHRGEADYGRQAQPIALPGRSPDRRSAPGLARAAKETTCPPKTNERRAAQQRRPSRRRPPSAITSSSRRR